METARMRSIKVHAAGIQAPDDLANHARVVAGTSHFAEHCASCHTAPGVEAGDMADGMYPKPPVLTDAPSRWSPAELFWILKNGIKMSGMPAWGDHGDDDLWNTVAFLEQLPGLSEQDYGKLVMESMSAGGHMMHGDMHGMGHGG
jgi:mono/diheme cytochrome c family protein